MGIEEQLYQELIEKMKTYHPTKDFDMVEKAYRLAVDAHKDQKRKSGEPYSDDPQAAVIAASASVAHSAAAVAASAAEDEKQDDPQTGIVSAASEETAATGIFTSASTVCCA